MRPARPSHVVLADHFADPGSSAHPLRLRLVSGEELDGHAPSFDVDRLVLEVTTAEGVVRTVRPEEIQAVYEHRLRWPVYAGFTVATVALGTGIGAVIAPLLSPFTAAWGAMVGALGGAIAAAVVRWLVPGLSPLAYAQLLDRLGRLAYWRPILPQPTGARTPE